MTRRKDVAGLAPSPLSGGAFATPTRQAPSLLFLDEDSFGERVAALRGRYEELTASTPADMADDAWAEAEQVVMQVGELVAERAEQSAGLENFDRTSTPEFEALTEARDQFRAVSDYLMADDTDAARHEQMWDRYRGLQMRLREAEAQVAGLDMSRLADLADGYSEVLAEVRPMGGVAHFDAKATRKARVAFEAAADVFPADWIEQSNNQVAPLPKVVKARAHYSHSHVQVTKKKDHMGVLEWAEDKPADDDKTRYVQMDPAEVGTAPKEGLNPYKGLMFEALPDGESFSRGRGVYLGPHNPDVAPRGAGWERYDLEDGRMGWRRPFTEMKVVESRAVPEIRTNDSGIEFDGRPSGYAVAVHEMSHRFEYTVPEIANLEAAFLQRRCDGASTERIYRGKDEWGTDGGFVDLYVGKRYAAPSGHHEWVQPAEVLSMGTEALFGGHHGGLVGSGRNRNVDTDHRSFVLGVMALAGRKENGIRSLDSRAAAHHV